MRLRHSLKLQDGRQSLQVLIKFPVQGELSGRDSPCRARTLFETGFQTYVLATRSNNRSTSKAKEGEGEKCLIKNMVLVRIIL